MTIAGLSLPELTAYDPGVSGEGSLDPIGMAALSDRLADELVPAIRSRMRRVRFLTAMAVGAIACELLGEEFTKDGVSTPSICFEWVAVEGFVRALPQKEFPQDIPGTQKTRALLRGPGRLSAGTYLKGPSVFGFNGVYKPFAVDAGVVTSTLDPGPQSANLLRVWESEQDADGFVDGIGSGGRLRSQTRDAVRTAMREGQCSLNPRSWLFGKLADKLRPDTAGPHERRQLRDRIFSGEHERRDELAAHLAPIDSEDLTEAELLQAVAPRCSAALRETIDAVVSYEQLAQRVDAAFRTLCRVSYAMGGRPMTARDVSEHEVFARCAAELPASFRKASEALGPLGFERRLEEESGEFAMPHTATELVMVLLDHHQRVQASKPPLGKRSWFEPLRDGWVVRPPYGSNQQRALSLGNAFVHPVRVASLKRFLDQTA